ncbi:L-2-amino-thiazoline-4-carboxylic acid hydrolase [Clostridiaceae bacterium M8S5]|nr:L-2-amino-thiazoline-4-carboxylic acid hydrolase [Clostridiaceae bacterium M8S5]
MEDSQYYVAMKAKLMKEAKSYLKFVIPLLEDKYSKEDINKIHNDTLEKYEELIPKFPYIGGKDNKLTSTLTKTSVMIALYRALLPYDVTPLKTGEYMTKALENKMDRIPKVIRLLMGRTMFSKRSMKKINKRAEKSQLRQYSKDWVWNIVKSNDNKFDIGIDYTECGIKKFVVEQEVEELLPYICNLDYALFRKFGLELTRTKTLANNDCCNFRIKKKGNPPPAWPPRI